MVRREMETVDIFFSELCVYHHFNKELKNYHVKTKNRLILFNHFHVFFYKEE